MATWTIMNSLWGDTNDIIETYHPRRVRCIFKQTKVNFIQMSLVEPNSFCNLWHICPIVFSNNCISVFLYICVFCSFSFWSDQFEILLVFHLTSQYFYSFTYVYCVYFFVHINKLKLKEPVAVCAPPVTTKSSLWAWGDFFSDWKHLVSIHFFKGLFLGHLG